MVGRFDRQVILAGFGEPSQVRLSQAKVLVVGAGGLGCPVITYLAAAGVGTIGIVDADTVSVQNLNRQVLYGKHDVGSFKVKVVERVLNAQYDDIEVNVICDYLTPDNAVHLIGKYDVVVDGTDNFETRLLVNDVCVLLAKPLVFGAIYQNQGQVAVFNVPNVHGTSVNYRDLFPVVTQTPDVPNCAETGVLGVLPGTIGILMATQTISVITGFGSILNDSVLVYDMLSNTMNTYTIEPNNKHNVDAPATVEQLRLMEYNRGCSLTSVCTWQDALRDLEREPQHSILVDIREPHETPKLSDVPVTQIPMTALVQNPSLLESFTNIYLFCQHGARSLAVATLCSKALPSSHVYSIEGGITVLPHTVQVADNA